jgi:uracil-DNA glycosylase family 4
VTELFLVGEAWGEKEAETGRPFVGSSGYILDQLLSQVGINRRECYLTNVFNLRPVRVKGRGHPRPTHASARQLCSPPVPDRT